MSTKKSPQKATKRRVTFQLTAPAAQTVMLMGDFNKWRPNSHPMKKDDEGVWKKTTMLPPGKYEYKFLVDGKWLSDPNNDQLCTNSFGTFNNIVAIPDK